MNGLLLWLLLSQAGDIATTGVGLRLGCVEAAPFYRSMSFPTVAAIKGGATVSVTIMLGRKANAYPKSSKAIAIGLASAGTFATVWNASQLRRCGR